MHHTASDATRKTLRAKYETERHADQYREWLAVLLGLCLSALLLYLLL